MVRLSYRQSRLATRELASIFFIFCNLRYEQTALEDKSPRLALRLYPPATGSPLTFLGVALARLYTLPPSSVMIAKMRMRGMTIIVSRVCNDSTLEKAPVFPSLVEVRFCKNLKNRPELEKADWKADPLSEKKKKKHSSLKAFSSITLRSRARVARAVRVPRQNIEKSRASRNPSDRKLPPSQQRCVKLRLFRHVKNATHRTLLGFSPRGEVHLHISAGTGPSTPTCPLDLQRCTDLTPPF
jgi:hypothetical protein